MSTIVDPRNDGLSQDSSIHGYQIHRMVELAEISAIYYELEHSATGARHVHISRNDAENTFGAAFKTVPVDSTGVAHILEHTGPCGSQRFPARDRCFSMPERIFTTVRRFCSC